MARRPTEALSVAPPGSQTAELLGRLHAWAAPLRERPDFRAFNRRKIGAALDLHGNREDHSYGDYEMPAELSAEYDAVMAFYYLHSACERLQGLPLYFRRFPFRAGEMRKVEHLQNMFDLFVAAFYVVQERLVAYLEALKPLADTPPNVGGVLKQYRKEFADELRSRHQTTHERPYDDIVYDRLWMSEIMAMHDEASDNWRREHLALYRRESIRWADLAARRGARVLYFLEAAASFTLAHTTFLPPASDAG